MTSLSEKYLIYEETRQKTNTQTVVGASRLLFGWPEAVDREATELKADTASAILEDCHIIYSGDVPKIK